MRQNESSAKKTVHSTTCLHKEVGKICELTEHLKTVEQKKQTKHAFIV